MIVHHWVSLSFIENDCWRVVEQTDALASLSLSDAQTPDLISLIGGPSKSKLLRELIDPEQQCPTHPRNGVHLWMEARSRQADSPRVFIDCELHRAQSPSMTDHEHTVTAPRRCHDIHWAKKHKHADVAHLFYDSVLAPLSSVVCYFASDLGGLRGVGKIFADVLVAKAPKNRIRADALPRALVIMDTLSYNFDSWDAESRLYKEIEEALAKMGYNPTETLPELLSHYREVRVLGLHKDSNPELRSKTLRRRINSVSSLVHSARRLSQTRFSAPHSNAFLGMLIENFCTKAVPFDYIRSSRAAGFSTQDFSLHLEDLLKSMPSEAWLWHTVIPLVTSALFLASYPPGSHYFDPNAVFSRLYSGICDVAMMEYSIFPEVRQKFVKTVKHEFVNMFRGFISDGRNSAAYLHRDTLKTLHTSLSELKSHRSCFCCLMRTPEKVVSCGHALCDVCIQTFGTPSTSEKNTFALHSCPLCGTIDEDAVFTFIPPTAGIRILSLDGGGVRGVVELAILKQLYAHFSCFRLSLSEYFDYICGTSAGGLIVLGLFLMQWTPEECLERFERLATQTFGSSSRALNSISRLRQTLISYVKDGKYESDIIEAAFQTLTKRPTQMFNPLKSETKVAVTTTTAKDVLTCLFANYNGNYRPSGIGYQIVRAKEPQDDVLVHEAAASTSAAPWFFKPKVLKNLGTFQDGGLQHNNPLSIALREYRFIWPEKGEPDFALSIGTGTTFNNTRVVFEPRSPVYSRTLQRLFRSFMRNIDGEKAWRDFINAVSESQRHRYYRLNIDLYGLEPDIDDVSSMKRLRHLTEQYVSSPAVTISIQEAMFASMFYFELEDIPIFDGDSYRCTGVIFCRMNMCKDARGVLYEKLLQSPYHFLIEGRPIRCVETIPKGLPLYRKRVELRVPSLDHDVSITIRGPSNAHYISGLPKKLTTLISCQKMHAPFGRINHQLFGRRLPPFPRKRKRENLESGAFF